uniref:Mutator-like transposase domain-containing protein n=1 Tax=Pristionchus pacificus TaxID=54126 RepID=A0A8R1YUX0_PRIPA
MTFIDLVDQLRDRQCVFIQWQTQVRKLAKYVAGVKSNDKAHQIDKLQPGGISIAIDGQYDTPGFNASNCKVTVMDAKLKVALSAASVHKSEPGIGLNRIIIDNFTHIDGISIRMESEGALRAIMDLINDGFVIKSRVSDGNATVDKKLRDNMQTASIEAERDWWHTQKTLEEEMEQKNNPILAQLYCPPFNHLFYCHKKYPKKEDRPLALELVQSFLMHVQGKHSWKKADSAEYEIIKEMVYSRAFEKAFLASSTLIDTALVECYHSISPFIYNIKMNSLVLHEQQGLRKEVRAFLLQRPARIAQSVKTKREPGEHPWRQEVLEESERVREELEEGRLMRRLGMPEDYVFEEILSLENARENSDYELDGEDEEYDDDEASERSAQL